MPLQLPTLPLGLHPTFRWAKQLQTFAGLLKAVSNPTLTFPSMEISPPPWPTSSAWDLIEIFPIPHDDRQLVCLT